MNNLKRARTMWKEFQNKPFPDGYAGVDVNGVCLTSLDDGAAGCISAYMGSGKLARSRYEILIACLGELDIVLPELTDSPREYFQLLKSLCVVVVRDTKAT